MSLRTRIALIAAAAVAVSVLAVSVGVYVATARTLHAAVDRTLLAQAQDIARRPQPAPGPRTGRFGGASVFVQVIDVFGEPLGTVGGVVGGVVLPVSEQARMVAAGLREALFETAPVQGVSLRILTAPTRGGAVQFARPIDEVEQSLERLREQLATGLFGGVLLAALLGIAVAQRAIRPVHQLTELAEEVAATQDLSRRLSTQGDDELGRLGHTMNTMLANLEQARSAQERLIADASHELRTPLTSLRTNVEVLASADRLDAADRADLIRDVVTQLEEFGRLVTGLVELARGARPVRAATPIALDELVQQVAAKARAFAGQTTPIIVEAQPTTVMGEGDQLSRAVSNLIDNAVKYGAGTAVRVNVERGTVTVQDRGPGIDPSDLPYLFDRFYRAPSARAASGSGLGLAIVRQVAESHRGTVLAANAEGGGAIFTLTLPEAPPAS